MGVDCRWQLKSCTVIGNLQMKITTVKIKFNQYSSCICMLDYILQHLLENSENNQLFLVFKPVGFAFYSQVYLNGRSMLKHFQFVFNRSKQSHFCDVISIQALG